MTPRSTCRYSLRANAGKLIGEGVGTALLLLAVVGSSTLAQRLAGGDAAMALLVNAFASAMALYALIAWLGPISGAHFNPLLTLSAWREGLLSGRIGLAMGVVQVIGATIGVALANVVSGVSVLALSSESRVGMSQLAGKFVASFALVGMIHCGMRTGSPTPAAAIAALDGSSFWYAASSFANPAATLARTLTGTAAGIRVADVPGFLLSELFGALAATSLFRLGLPRPVNDGTDVVEPASLHIGELK